VFDGERGRSESEPDVPIADGSRVAGAWNGKQSTRIPGGSDKNPKCESISAFQHDEIPVVTIGLFPSLSRRGIISSRFRVDE
jgi:hypothetical protein